MKHLNFSSAYLVEEICFKLAVLFLENLLSEPTQFGFESKLFIIILVVGQSNHHSSLAAVAWLYHYLRHNFAYRLWFLGLKPAVSATGMNPAFYDSLEARKHSKPARMNKSSTHWAEVSVFFENSKHL